MQTRIVFLAAAASMGLVAAGSAQNAPIIHDAEHYILEA
jgi:hypothetical protein